MSFSNIIPQSTKSVVSDAHIYQLRSSQVTNKDRLERTNQQSFNPHSHPLVKFQIILPHEQSLFHVLPFSRSSDDEIHTTGLALEFPH
jgi:hypothetical protein